MGRLLKEVPEESENKLEIELLQNILDSINDMRHNKNVSNALADFRRKRVFALDVRITGNKEKIRTALEYLSERFELCGLYCDDIWQEEEDFIIVSYNRDANMFFSYNFITTICSEIAEECDVKIEIEKKCG